MFRYKSKNKKVRLISDFPLCLWCGVLFWSLVFSGRPAHKRLRHENDPDHCVIRRNRRVPPPAVAVCFRRLLSRETFLIGFSGGEKKRKRVIFRPSRVGRRRLRRVKTKSPVTANTRAAVVQYRCDNNSRCLPGLVNEPPARPFALCLTAGHLHSRGLCAAKTPKYYALRYNSFRRLEWKARNA